MISLSWNKSLLGRARSRPARLVVREPIDRTSQLRRLALVWFVGALLLALATYLCRDLDLDESAAKCVFLSVIVFVSLMDSGPFAFCVLPDHYRLH
jgi:hypothetical protein